jgi:hypothetical protein
MSRSTLGVAGPYNYARNTPVRLIDPSGRQGWPPQRFNPSPNPFRWAYGNWCGWFRSGQGGGPIDFLDWACRRHDRCLGQWWSPFVRLTPCTAQMCADLIFALEQGCYAQYADTPLELWTCEEAAGQAMSFFCSATLWLACPPWLLRPWLPPWDPM